MLLKNLSQFFQPFICKNFTENGFAKFLEGFYLFLPFVSKPDLKLYHRLLNIYMQYAQGMTMPSSILAWPNHTLFILHILTYYDFLRILLFLETWIVIKEVDVGIILFI